VIELVVRRLAYRAGLRQKHSSPNVQMKNGAYILLDQWDDMSRDF
jgi:hypothetical protein